MNNVNEKNKPKDPVKLPDPDPIITDPTQPTPTLDPKNPVQTPSKTEADTEDDSEEHIT